MQKNHFLFYFLILPLFLISLGQNTFAEDVSLATASKNLMQPVSLFTEMIYNICYVAAITIFISSIAQFRAHRQSPNQTPLNRPIVLLILSIIVALIPITAKLSEAAKYTAGS